MLDFGFATPQEVGIELCQRLRSQRLVQGLTQADLAQRAGISLSTVKLMETKGQSTLQNFIGVVLGLGLIDGMQTLFALKPQSIAQMERAEQAHRQRAPRKARIKPPAP
jgi:transcriptional regulator with XRE-family HTH domain